MQTDLELVSQLGCGLLSSRGRRTNNQSSRSVLTGDLMPAAGNRTDGNLYAGAVEGKG